jgi:hypothetical protein
MRDSRYAMLAARLLAREESRPIPTAAVRARSLETIERALAAQEARHWPSAKLAVVATAAASAVIWIAVEALRAAHSGAVSERVAVVASPLGAGARWADSLNESPLAPQLKLRVGSSVVTEVGGGARLELSTGTRLELEGASTLTSRNQEQLQRFTLERGALGAHIAKLGAAERFVVDTPDAEVEVRGTVFHLRVLAAPEACGGGSRTRLEVDEGIVEVRAGGSTARVPAGQRWPLDCTVHRDAVSSEAPRALPLPATAPVNSASTEPVPEPAKAPSAPEATHLEKSRSAPRSALSAQTDLFAAGMRAQRRGDIDSALGVYADLLRLYPTSPLAENALVERMRLLAPNAADARREALRYLERYPNGFARAEAERLSRAP